MHSPHNPNCTDRTSGAQRTIVQRKLSPIRRIALVALLAGVGLVALAVQDNATSDQSSAVPAETTTTNRDYFPAQFTIDAKAGDGNVMTYEHD